MCKCDIISYCIINKKLYLQQQQNSFRAHQNMFKDSGRSLKHIKIYYYYYLNNVNTLNFLELSYKFIIIIIIILCTINYKMFKIPQKNMKKILWCNKEKILFFQQLKKTICFIKISLLYRYEKKMLLAFFNLTKEN